MDYLQLCQAVAQECGIVNQLPGLTTVATDASTAPRIVRIITWTNSAWRDIQTRRNAWRWMRKELPSSPVPVTTIGQARYSAASFGVTSFQRWITDSTRERRFPFTIYDASIGAADEQEIRQVDWDYWRRTYTRGVQTNNRPIEYAISPQRELCLGPIPNKTYVVRGEYYKGTQELTADADIPELPDEHHHWVIVWRALVLLERFGEAVPTARAEFEQRVGDLERDQLDTDGIRIDVDPLA